MSHSPQSCVLLCILDGWGHGASSPHNSITMAHTPHMDHLMSTCPHALLETSGLSVGLPEGQMGNSEVGHMTMGAGRVIYQDLPRISLSLSSGQMVQEPGLCDFISRVLKGTGVCHLMGILSDGGVHGHIDHLVGLAKIMAHQGITVYIHAFLDGRDTPPQSAHLYVDGLMTALDDEPRIMLQTLGGRYYAMDRDHRWDRVQKAFNAMVHGQADHSFIDPQLFLRQSYDQGLGDEFVVPGIRKGYAGMGSHDGLFMVNYRADRAIQLLTSLAESSFSAFDRQGFCHQGPRLGMVSYASHLDLLYPSLSTPRQVEETLGELVSRAGLSQLRLAETEKYAHVTYFFNAGKNDVLAGEDRILVPSPKVASYDLAPEMSAGQITAHLCEAVASHKYALIVVNYANADMVGHTGHLKQAVSAIEYLDSCIGQMLECAQSHGVTVLITADHGNAECMQDPQSGSPHTAHTLNKVPVLLIGGGKGVTLVDGSLADIAPTVLSLLNIKQSNDMTGKSLLVSG